MLTFFSMAASGTVFCLSSSETETTGIEAEIRAKLIGV